MYNEAHQVVPTALAPSSASTSSPSETGTPPAATISGNASQDFVSSPFEGDFDYCRIGASEAAKSGDIWPGRPLIRPTVTFKNKKEDWKQECNKEYPNSSSHSPGLFTIQCACEHPKLIGVMIMDESESISTAISSLITRFSPLPHVVFYDNACNMAKSMSLRFQWMFHETALLCNRFHYGGHKCSSHFDPDAFRLADNIQKSGAEALNKQWKASRTHVRYLSPETIVTFLFLHMMFLNLRALLRDDGKSDDVSEKDFYAFELS